MLDTQQLLGFAIKRPISKALCIPCGGVELARPGYHNHDDQLAAPWAEAPSERKTELAASSPLAFSSTAAS